VPILAAGVGLLGGVLGALAGGWIANEGQKSRFETERAAAIHDLRIETYANYVAAAEEAALAILTHPETGRVATLRSVVSARARVYLTTENNGVIDAVNETTDALYTWNEAQTKVLEQQATDGEADQAAIDAADEAEGNYVDAIDQFIDEARLDVETIEG
jgi:hypothetical protein